MSTRRSGLARPSRRATAVSLVVSLALSCRGDGPAATQADMTPTRGVILISLDTLGAAHLGAYGYERATSPFFDTLATRGVLFENAFVQYPSTLVSHSSIFTGLYPQEHGARPPGRVVSAEIEVLPERFRDHGFTTAGFTEGGFVGRSFGFERGFDEFEERLEFSLDTEIEATFDRGLDFLRRRGPDERFFLFLHSYSIHDPYDPPPPYDTMFGPAADLDSSGRFLRDVYMGRATIDAPAVEALRARYDGSVRYVDSVLERFFGELEEMGIAEEVTVVITSDHGEEFAQHGRLGHFQVYAETTHVPLLVIHPGRRRGARIASLVESVDLAPTLFEIAGIALPDGLSGESLVPLLAAGEGAADGSAYAEVFDQESQQSLVRFADGAPHQYIATERVAEPDGTWVTHAVAFDTSQDRLDLALVSFPAERSVSITVDGEPLEPLTVGGGWAPLALDLSSGQSPHRIELATAECSVPLWIGLGEDSRCLSFKVRGAALRRGELFDLNAAERSAADLAADRPQLYRQLARALADTVFTPRAAPESGTLSGETREVLRALGYIQ